MDLENVQLLQSVCRTCLTKHNNMKDIFNLADIITSCAPIQLEQDDGLPSNICLDCIVLAKKAYGFRLLCEHSDNVLRESLGRNSNATIKTEKLDLNFEEVHIDGNYSTCNKTELLQTNNLSFEINNLNGISPSDENQVFQIKTEILESEDYKEFQTCNTETLITSHSLCNTTHAQDNATNSQATTHNVNKKKRDEEKSKVTTDVPNDEKDGSEPESEFTCQYCDQKFLLKKNLQIHERKHLELKCNVCGKCLANREKYRKHVGVHKRKGVYICPTCGKHFTYPENLKVHQRIHTGIKPFSCRFCNKSFTQWSERRSHEFCHTSEKSYLCSTCGTKFARSASLLNHTRRVHCASTEERPHVCAICNKKFKVRRDLDKHMFCHSEKRSFVCKVCNKGFKHRASLRLHEKIHTGIKPHVCQICQRAFLQKHVLTSHLRTHAP